MHFPKLKSFLKMLLYVVSTASILSLFLWGIRILTTAVLKGAF